MDQILSDFTDTTTDGMPEDYFVRVMGEQGDYSLLVTKDAGFDTEPNDGLGQGCARHQSERERYSVLCLPMDAGRTSIITASWQMPAMS